MLALDATTGPLAAPRSGRVTAGAPDDASLVAKAQAGSADAWRELFDRHWAKAYRAAFLIVHDAAAAEDVAQEAFLSALAALDRFDRRRPFGPWLHRIAVNRAIDHARGTARRREVGGDSVPEIGVAARAEGDDRLSAAIAALPVEQRAVVVMRYLLDWTPGEIARGLGVPRGTVNSRLRRALDRLGALLDSEVRP